MINEEQRLREEAERDFSALKGVLGADLPSIYLRPDCKSAGISLDDTRVMASRVEALGGDEQRFDSEELGGGPLLRAAYLLDRVRRVLGIPLAEVRFEPGTQFVHLSLADLRAVCVRLEAIREGKPLADGYL